MNGLEVFILKIGLGESLSHTEGVFSTAEKAADMARRIMKEDGREWEEMLPGKFWRCGQSFMVVNGWMVQ